RMERTGVPPGAPVGIAMDGSAAYVTVLIGTILAGAAAAPLNLALTTTESERYLDLLDPFAIVADGRGMERLPRGVASLDVDTDPRAVRLIDRLDTSPHLAYRTGVDQPPEAPALLFPTGGTTGLPKASVLSHRGSLLWGLSMAGHGRAGAGVELFFLQFFHI